MQGGQSRAGADHWQGVGGGNGFGGGVQQGQHGDGYWGGHVAGLSAGPWQVFNGDGWEGRHRCGGGPGGWGRKEIMTEATG